MVRAKTDEQEKLRSRGFGSRRCFGKLTSLVGGGVDLDKRCGDHQSGGPPKAARRKYNSPIRPTSPHNPASDTIFCSHFSVTVERTQKKSHERSADPASKGRKNSDSQNEPVKHSATCERTVLSKSRSSWRKPSTIFAHQRLPSRRRRPLILLCSCHHPSWSASCYTAHVSYRRLTGCLSARCRHLRHHHLNPAVRAIPIPERFQPRLVPRRRARQRAREKPRQGSCHHLPHHLLPSPVLHAFLWPLRRQPIPREALAQSTVSLGLTTQATTSPRRNPPKLLVRSTSTTRIGARCLRETVRMGRH